MLAIQNPVNHETSVPKKWWNWCLHEEGKLAVDEVGKETFFISKSFNNFLRFIQNLSSSRICFLIKSIIFIFIYDFIAKLALKLALRKFLLSYLMWFWIRFFLSKKIVSHVFTISRTCSRAATKCEICSELILQH